MELQVVRTDHGYGGYGKTQKIDPIFTIDLQQHFEDAVYYKNFIIQAT